MDADGVIIRPRTHGQVSASRVDCAINGDVPAARIEVSNVGVELDVTSSFHHCPTFDHNVVASIQHDLSGTGVNLYT